MPTYSQDTTQEETSSFLGFPDFFSQFQSNFITDNQAASSSEPPSTEDFEDLSLEDFLASPEYEEILKEALAENQGLIDYPMILASSLSEIEHREIMVEDAYALYRHILHLIFRAPPDKKNFESISFKKEINTEMLSELLDIYDNWNDSGAYFVAGLLLEGRIINATGKIDNPEAYWEKRLHDAISMYGKAAKDPAFKTVATLMLWTLKTKSTIPSIQMRLSQYELLVPPTNHPERTSLTKPQNSIMRTAMAHSLFYTPTMIEPVIKPPIDLLYR